MLNRNLSAIENMMRSLNERFESSGMTDRIAYLVKIFGISNGKSAISYLKGRMREDLGTDDKSIARYNDTCDFLDAAEKVVIYLLENNKELDSISWFYQMVAMVIDANGDISVLDQTEENEEIVTAENPKELDLDEYSIIQPFSFCEPKDLFAAKQLLDCIRIVHNKPEYLYTAPNCRTYFQFAVAQNIIQVFNALKERLRINDITPFERKVMALITHLIECNTFELPTVFVSNSEFTANKKTITMGKIKVSGIDIKELNNVKLLKPNDFTTDIKYVVKKVTDEIGREITVYFIFD